MLLFWIVMLVFNVYAAFILMGTWQAIVSLTCASFAAFYIIQDMRGVK